MRGFGKSFSSASFTFARYTIKERVTPNLTIKQRVTPKQGRVVLFDGWLMHTAEQPINNVRCIVNYNLD